MSDELVSDAPGEAEAEAEPEPNVRMVKAEVVYSTVQLSNALSTDSEDGLGVIFQKAGAITPTYNLAELCELFRKSSALRPNIDAYATNIDGLGYRIEPIIDVDAQDADKKIAEVIYQERLYDEDNATGLEASDAPEVKEPTDQEIQARKEEIKRNGRYEKAWLENLFRFCTRGYSFTELCERTRTDVEAMGNGYWEVIRNPVRKRRIKIAHLPGYTVRAMKLGDPVQITVRQNKSVISFEMVEEWTRFRKYVQIVQGKKVYFKEFGDPRVMSPKTGRYFATPEAMLEAEPTTATKSKQADGTIKAVPTVATEIIHWKIYAPDGGAYGIARWVGAILSVKGSIAADEVNLLYFDNKTIPSMAVICEGGGALTKVSKDALIDCFKTQIKGRKNFHACIFIEGMQASENGNTANDGKLRIKLQPLTDQQNKDGLFLEYDKKNELKVGQQFRLPPLLRGDTKDFNKSTADAAVALSEDQVFAPIRGKKDFTINDGLLAELGVRYHRFVSNGPVLTDPETRAETIDKLSGVLTVNEARKAAGDVFGERFPAIEEPWAEKPMPLVLAEMRAGAAPGQDDPNADPDADPEDESPTATKKKPKAKSPKADEKDDAEAAGAKVKKSTPFGDKISALRMALDAAEGQLVDERFKVTKRLGEGGQEEILVQVDREVMSGWFTSDNDETTT